MHSGGEHARRRRRVNNGCSGGGRTGCDVVCELWRGARLLVCCGGDGIVWIVTSVSFVGGVEKGGYGNSRRCRGGETCVTGGV